MKKHFLLLALAALCSLGVWANQAFWSCGATDASQMPLSNQVSTIDGISVSTTCTSYATYWYTAGNKWIMLKATPTDYVYITTQSSANLALKKVDLVVDWNQVYDEAGEGAWYVIRFSTESPFSETSMTSDIYTRYKKDGDNLTFDVPDGAKSVRIGRDGDPNYYSTLLYSMSVTAESASSQEQQEQPTSTIAEWGYLQSTSSYVNEFPTTSSFNQNGVTVNATYGQILTAGFCAHSIDGLQMNDAAHHFDISVEEGKVISQVSSSNSIANYLQISFSSEATFDGSKLVGDVVPLPGNGTWANQVITETVAPKGARSARIAVVNGVNLDWNATLYYLKVETATATQEETEEETGQDVGALCPAGDNFATGWNGRNPMTFAEGVYTWTGQISVPTSGENGFKFIGSTNTNDWWPQISPLSNTTVPAEGGTFAIHKYNTDSEAPNSDGPKFIISTTGQYTISVKFTSSTDGTMTITPAGSQEEQGEQGEGQEEQQGGMDDTPPSSGLSFVGDLAGAVNGQAITLDWFYNLPISLAQHGDAIGSDGSYSSSTYDQNTGIRTIVYNAGAGQKPHYAIDFKTPDVANCRSLSFECRGVNNGTNPKMLPYTWVREPNWNGDLVADAVELTSEWQTIVATPKYWFSRDAVNGGACTYTYDAYPVGCIGFFPIADNAVSGGTFQVCNAYFQTLNSNSQATIKLVRKVGSAPANASDGDVLYTGAPTTYTDNDLSPETHYYYRVFATYNEQTYMSNAWDYTTPAVPKHNVTYNMNGAPGDAPQQAAVGEGFSFTLAKASWQDHVLTGWNDGTNTYPVGALYTMGTTDVTLTAQWRDFVPVFVDATWRYNGNNILPSATSSTVNEITLTSNFATNNASWLLGDYYLVYNYGQCGEDNALDITVTEGLALKNVTTSINFISSVGVGNIKIQFSSAPQYDATQLVGDPVVLTGAEDQTTETPCSIDAPTGALSARIYGPKGWGPHLYSITVYAGPAVEVTHTVSYLAGEGEGTMSDETVAYTKKFTLPQPVGLSYEGHTFTGWNDGTNTYPVGAEYTMPDNDVTFTAQWKEFPAIPGVLDINDAALAGTEWSIADGWIKRGDVSPTTGSVTWMVNATKAGEYKVSVNVSCDNTADLLITIYDSEQKSISNLTKASGWQISGVKQLGAVQIPAQGTYTVVATCATAHSHTWFKDLTFEYVKPTPTASFATLMKDLYPEDTYTQTVTTNSTGAVTYSSNNESVATVDPATGEVTAVAQGTATITATIAATEDFKETSTSYTISVLAAPVAGRKYYIDPGTDRLYDVIENAQENDTVVFRNGTYTENYSRTFKTTITLMADEGAHPILDISTHWIKATKGITIDGIEIVATDNYVLYLNGGSSDDMILRNVKINNPNAYVSIKAESAMNRLIIDNCVILAKTYGLHHGYNANLISITNTTFMGATYAALYLQNSTAIPTIIDHCTFYNNLNSGNFIVHLQGFNGSQTTVSNCVAYNTPASSGYAIVGNNTNKPTVTNCMINNCGTATHSTTNTNLWTDNPLIYVENGDYYYQNGSPIIGKATDGSNLGDPRWHVATLIIDEAATEKTVLTENLNQAVNVQLVRSLTGGMFNTFCLPFDLNADQIAVSDLDGAQIIELTSTSFEDGKLYLNFEEVEAIEAGVAYLIAPVADVENPAFEGVTIALDEAPEVVVGDVDVKPSFIVTNIAASPANLFLYQDNTLYYAGEDTEMNGMRAYFHVHNDMGLIPARMRIGRRTPTDDQQVSADTNDGKFLYRGHLYIRRNGVVYGVLGY